MVQVRDFAAKRGLLDDAVSIEQQFAQGKQIINGLIDDPGLLDQIEGAEARALMESLLAVDAMRMEQYREIEIMQARLEERHPLTSFALPGLPE